MFDPTPGVRVFREPSGPGKPNRIELGLGGENALARHAVPMSVDPTNRLALIARPFTYEVRGEVAAEPLVQTDFVVDGRTLAARFGFDAQRPWFGRTCFGDPPVQRDRALLALRGLAEPQTQLRSGRFVIYRCHRGCDYCGVISCLIERRDSTLVWRDLRFEEKADEEEDTEPPLYPLVIDELVFELTDYEAAIAQHVERMDES